MPENAKKPQIRFKGFTDAWEQRKLGEIANIVGGGTPSTSISEYWNGDIDWYAPAEMEGKRYANGSAKKITKLGLQNCSAQILPAGRTILFTSRAGIGKMAILKRPGSTNQGFQSLVLNQEINPYFIYSLCDEIKEKAESVAAGSTFLEISGKALGNIEILMPKELEQNKVSNYFLKLDNLITLHQRKLDKLKNIKKSMLEKMFPKNGSNVPEIRFTGFTDAWEQRKLGNLVIDTIDNRGKNPPYYCESGIPIIDNFMIKNSGYPDLSTATRYIDDFLFENFIRKYNEIDDTLITLVGNGIGQIALFPKGKSAIIQNTLGLRFSEDKIFMYYILLSKHSEIVKLDRGMAQPSIRQDELKDVNLNIPKRKEQFLLGKYFRNLDNLITLHQRKLEKLQNIKKACLEKMFV